MTLWLSIETATAVGSAAVGSRGTVLAELSFADRRHAVSLTPSIQELFKLAGRDVADLGGLVVANGPGSFTGLRIGLATAKGIFQAHPHVEFRIVPSMLATAWRHRGVDDGHVGVWYDALRGEVFAAVYDLRTSPIGIVLPPTRTSPGALIASGDGPTVVVGDGAVAFPDEALQWTGRQPIGPPDCVPRAGALLELLAIEGASKEVTDPAAFEPTYGRDAEAQVRWEAKHGRPLPLS